VLLKYILKMKKSGKTIQITESALVDMIENIVTEAVAEKKKIWIAEQKQKQAKIIEEQVEKVLEAKLKTLFESKK
jgi:hypothetical protein